MLLQSFLTGRGLWFEICGLTNICGGRMFTALATLRELNIKKFSDV